MIELYTWGTPNGYKVAMLLEALEVPYKVFPIDINQNEAHKQNEKFVRITGGNGRIPGIVDTDNDNFTVFESAACCLYLARKYNKFLPSDPKLLSEVEQWCMFQMAGVGPMYGQWNHFRQRDNEDVKNYGMKRYGDEGKRLSMVLNNRLEGRDYLVGNNLTVADFVMYPWVKLMGGIMSREHKNVQRWGAKCEEHPAFKKGMTIGKEPYSKL